MKPYVIKTEAQYREYLAEIDRLVSIDPKPESPEGKSLELLALLVEAFEKERYSLPHPSPIDAILFRMEEQGLQQKDLVPMIGSKSKVSEVLSGKRRLTVQMIRALSEGLGISADVLVAETARDNDETNTADWSKYPIQEMARRGWLGNVGKLNAESAVEKVKEFFSQVAGTGIGPAYFRRTMHIGGEVTTDIYALNAWLARAIVRSREIKVVRGSFSKPKEPENFLREIAQLSWSEQGPRLAQEFLAKRGIALVVERHLPKTYLDGAALLDFDGTPIVGVTLRHDRLDNFWFTLLHELAHLVCHVKGKQDAFVDNTENDPNEEQTELEANALAQEALIPRAVWRRSDAFRLQTPESIFSLSKELKIHPSIIAGRIRKETGNYKRFSNLVGHGEVERLLDCASK